jgi:hypothetical protein
MHKDRHVGCRLGRHLARPFRGPALLAWSFAAALFLSVSRSHAVCGSRKSHLDPQLDARIAPFSPRFAPVVRSNGDSHPVQDPVEIEQDSAAGLYPQLVPCPRSERDVGCQRHELGNESARPFLVLTGRRLS